jgi:Protein of unknown function (DUF2934)
MRPGVEIMDPGGFVQHPASMHEQIAMLAYKFWEERGCPFGTPETDWFRAEQELTKPQSALSRLAREVGTAIGTVVGLHKSLLPQ